MIVVDTCIIIHLFNATELTFQAQHLLEIDSDWHVPTTWREEYANVLAKLYKKNKCSPQSVLELFQQTCDQLQNREHSVQTKDALECALQYQISVYDAHFVVLAEQSDSTLITEDIEVLKKCPKIARSMRKYLPH
jgi:predicted nucleic acid-binding protein